MALFKKKEGEKEAADKESEELPDELPSLAEDIAEEKETPADDKSPDKPVEKPEEKPSDDLELPDLPDEINEAPAEQPAQQAVPTAAASPVQGESFFTNVYDKLKANELMSKNILSEMSDYWAEKMSPEDIKMPSLVEIEKRIAQKVEDLKRLETEWINHKKEMHKLNILITNDETEIGLRTQELQDLIKEQDRLIRLQKDTATHPKPAQPERVVIPHSRAPADKPFVLKDGTKIFSISELVASLSTMSQEEFSNYIQPENHLANWVENVFQNRMLANKVRMTSSPSKLAYMLSESQ